MFPHKLHQLRGVFVRKIWTSKIRQQSFGGIIMVGLSNVGQYFNFINYRPKLRDRGKMGSTSNIAMDWTYVDPGIWIHPYESRQNQGIFFRFLGCFALSMTNLTFSSYFSNFDQTLINFEDFFFLHLIARKLLYTNPWLVSLKTSSQDIGKGTEDCKGTQCIIVYRTTRNRWEDHLPESQESPIKI